MLKTKCRRALPSDTNQPGSPNERCRLASKSIPAGLSARNNNLWRAVGGITMDEPGYIYRFGSSVGVKLKLPRPKNCRGRRSGGPKNEHKMCRKVASGRRINQSALLVLSSSPGRRRDGAGSSGEEAAVGGPIHDTDPSLCPWQHKRMPRLPSRPGTGLWSFLKGYHQ